jgi:hypothetical protein
MHPALQSFDGIHGHVIHGLHVLEALFVREQVWTGNVRIQRPLFLGPHGLEYAHIMETL